MNNREKLIGELSSLVDSAKARIDALHPDSPLRGTSPCEILWMSDDELRRREELTLALSAIDGPSRDVDCARKRLAAKHAARRDLTVAPSDEQVCNYALHGWMYDYIERYAEKHHVFAGDLLDTLDMLESASEPLSAQALQWRQRQRARPPAIERDHARVGW